MNTGVKTEKERSNEEQQVKRQQTEDLEDEQIVSLTNQAHYALLKQSDANGEQSVAAVKQSDAMESKRLILNAENQKRTMRYVEKKPLHAPAVTENAENTGASIRFKEIIAGEMDGTKKENSFKEFMKFSTDLETEATKANGRNSNEKPMETANAVKFSNSGQQGVNPMASGKSSLQLPAKAVSELSKLTSADLAADKNSGKKVTAKNPSLSNMSNENSIFNRKGEAGGKAEVSPGKTTAPLNIKDVVGTVKIMISSKTNEMVLQLAPEHLGKLEIRLRKEGDKLIGRFKVESLQAKEAIESQLYQLKQGLAEQGVHVEEFTVIIKGESDASQSFAFNQGDGSNTNQSRHPSTSENQSRSEIQTATNTVSPLHKNTSGLNIYA
ncbi:MAG: flagellar hook-length control protein FliK [SAR324 cluster bacterium]|nr:flagellar hook-length control protein FliK [SAR324 cluster bacterium]